MIGRDRITGLVLAGGRGSRMGGVDKGLRLHRGLPLAQHALARLAPQVGGLLLSANRNLPDYAAMGVPVVADATEGFAGPLAGLQAGLARCATPWLATVPCDSPEFPLDLVERLATALDAEGAEIAMAVTVEGGARRLQPVFSLVRTTLADSLGRFLIGGQRKVERWAALHRTVEVGFDDPRAFVNANTAAELRRLRQG